MGVEFGGHGAWPQFETALRGLEKCSTLFPPLRLAVHALVECVKELPVRFSSFQEVSAVLKTAALHTGSEQAPPGVL
jgi:hypothetical protein